MGRALQNNIQISNLQEPLLYYRIEGIQSRRSNLAAIKRQIFSKYSSNTLSIKYNILKILSILVRFYQFLLENGLIKSKVLIVKCLVIGGSGFIGSFLIKS